MTAQLNWTQSSTEILVAISLILSLS